MPVIEFFFLGTMHVIDYEVGLINMYNINNYIPIKIYMLLSFINVTNVSLFRIIYLQLT